MLVCGKLDKKFVMLRRVVGVTEAENILDELSSRIGCIYLMI